ncbi:MAG: hypothetical protein ACM3SP_21190 [Chloroflexota bacterium]
MVQQTVPSFPRRSGVAHLGLETGRRVDITATAVLPFYIWSASLCMTEPAPFYDKGGRISVITGKPLASVGF